MKKKTGFFQLEFEEGKTKLISPYESTIDKIRKGEKVKVKFQPEKPRKPGKAFGGIKLNKSLL